jgi:hypothetical protein
LDRKDCAITEEIHKLQGKLYLALCGPTLAPSNDELAAMSSSRMAPDSMPKAPTH